MARTGACQKRRRRLSRPLRCLFLLLAAILGSTVFLGFLGFLGGTVILGPESAGATTATPAQALASAGAAAKGEPSFHYVSTQTQSGQSVLISGDVSRTGGQQTIVADIGGQVGHVTVSLVDGAAYFRGDEAGLQNFMQLPAGLAAEYTNQWISLAKDDPGYAGVAAGLTTASALSQVAIAQPLTLRGLTRKMGQRVLTIEGTDRETPSGATKPVTIPVKLYVKASGNPLPVLYSATSVVDNHRVSQSVSFSHWKEPASVSAPVGAVPMSSLGGGPTEA
jgi:hypothetical protein